jgi:CspA family cold shock protein
MQKNTMKSSGKGTVKFFDETKGFGFIKVEGSDKDIFFHVSKLLDEVGQGDEVKFDVEEGKKGLNAINVQLA